jgi:hypothetical protein
MLKIFGRTSNSKQSKPKFKSRLNPSKAALYVDTENLLAAAQSTVKAIVEKWPEGTPPLSSLHLYVRADRVALWEMWATSRYPSLTVTVKGIQHFSHNHSKNSADMAIAMDAVADFVTGETEFIAVMSDDSDFMPVFAKLKDMADGRAPFLWLVTDRVRTRSNTIEEYFPSDHIHTVKVSAPTNDMILLRPADDTRTAGATRTEDAMRVADARVLEEMAELIIRQTPIGSFKSTDCLPIIKTRFPHHPISRMQGGSFGTEFTNKLWPLLEKRGVQVRSKRPRKYEMTSEVKNAVQPRRRTALP